MVRETKLYKILGVESDAPENDIKRAYKKLAVQFHPDKNPDPSASEKFKEISRAYEVLSDESTRKVYDKYGEKGLEEGGGGGGSSAQDIFSSFFGGGGGGGGFGGMFGGGQERGPRKGKDVGHAMPVTLEDLYNGKTRKLALNKQVLCGGCKGSGSKVKGKSITCQDCRGQGIKIVIRQLGPGMVQQMQTTCPNCKGEGTAIDPKDRCGTCHGNRVSQEKKILEVHIEKGMKHGEKITFANEGDQHPDIAPGDVVIVLQEKKHDIFTRKGMDLVIPKTVSLGQALCGFSFPITHLDGRTLLAKTQPGTILKQNQLMAIPGEGMPKHRNPYDKGSLIIQFSIEMPESLSPEAVQQMAKLLPPPTQKEASFEPAEAEECFLHPTTLGAEAGGRGMQDDDDDDDPRGGGPGGAQCVHQ